MRKNRTMMSAVLLVICIIVFGAVSLMIRKQTTGETGTAGDFANILYIGKSANIMYVLLIITGIVWTAASSILKANISMKIVGWLIQIVGYFLRFLLFTFSMFKGVDWYMFSGSKIFNMQMLALLCTLILPFITASVTKSIVREKRVNAVRKAVKQTEEL